MTYLSSGLDGGAVLQQQLDHLDAVLLAGYVQGREAVESPRVRVGLAVEQELGHAHVPAMRGHVERGEVVDGDLVHRRAMVEQHPRRVHVVALRGHVQRCQPVLRKEKRKRVKFAVTAWVNAFILLF